MIFALGFFAYSLLVVVKAPSLSGTPYLTAVYSLIYRFRRVKLKHKESTPPTSTFCSASPMDIPTLPLDLHLTPL